MSVSVSVCVMSWCSVGVREQQGKVYVLHLPTSDGIALYFERLGMAVVFGLMLTMEGCMISLTMLLCVCDCIRKQELCRRD